MFKLLKKSKISNARLGILKTPHGDIKTPFFMPDATRGVVKLLSSVELSALGLDCFVANTLHLFLRPGIKLIKRCGGLHNFINWRKPILTDSGGYQIFSLIHENQKNGKITEGGALFNSPLDGAKIKLTPEQSIKIQLTLNSDMIVCLDDCPPNNYSEDKLRISVARTISWAKRCKLEYNRNVKSQMSKVKNYKRPLLFAVIQGGNNLALRDYCAKELLKIGFDGFGFGARHVDESGNFLSKTLERTARLIPENNLRFGLGIGLPEDIARAVKMGWDIFDCVIPTREGRHGRLFLRKKITSYKLGIRNRNAKNIYNAINITNAKFARDFSPINAESNLVELKNYSKAYLHYLFKINEPLAARLASLNNLEFYLNILSEIRGLIKKNMF